MNVPLRALSWAVRFFWIIALAIAVTCVYSATLIRINFQDPIMNLTGGEIEVTLPIEFNNNGYYSIANFNVTTLLLDHENRQLSKGSAYIAQIPPQDNQTILHTVDFDFNEIVTRTDYLFNDSDFTLQGTIHLDYANLIPFAVKANKTMPWGAPLFNLTVGTPLSSVFNFTHVRFILPLSFQNHSPYFDVAGTIRAEIYNNISQLIGNGSTLVDVPTHSNYDGTIQILVNVGMMTGNGQIHLYVETGMFDYGPVVINYG